MARRYMKNERQDNTLQTTALVHEVYLRLVDVTKVEWQQRGQFFAIAAQMMRRILVDAARKRASHKRGGVARRVNLEETATLSSIAGPVHSGSGRCPDGVLTIGSAPRQGCRASLFRRIDRGGNRCGTRRLSSHGQARLGSC